MSSSVNGPASKLIYYIELDLEKAQQFDNAISRLGIRSLNQIPEGRERDFVTVLRPNQPLKYYSTTDYQTIQKVFQNTFPNISPIEKQQLIFLQTIGGFFEGLKAIRNFIKEGKPSKEQQAGYRQMISNIGQYFNDKLWPKFEEIRALITVMQTELNDTKQSIKPPPPLTLPKEIDEGILTLPEFEVVPSNEKEEDLLLYLTKLNNKVENSLNLSYRLDKIQTLYAINFLLYHFNSLIALQGKWPAGYKHLAEDCLVNIYKLYSEYIIRLNSLP